MTPVKVKSAALFHSNESTDSNFLLPARVCLLLMFCLAGYGLFAQDTISPVSMPPDTPLQDTLSDTDEAEEAMGIFAVHSKEHSPMKATLLSAALPGLGQAYNGKFWKVPFVYAGFGGVIYALNFNNNQYQHFRRAWIAKIDGNPNTADEYPTVTPERLQREMNRWRRNVEISYIAGAALYILNVLDATVDAHLLDFDVGEDLSLNLRPTVLPTINNQGRAGKPVSGLSLSFHF
ncbi:MAG: DUF5683 domain-containing protein [Bacteroidota bacterium]